MEHDEEQNITPIGTIKQLYSHFHLHATVYHSTSVVEEEVVWYSQKEIGTLALSGADHKAFALLKKHDV